LRAFSGFVRIAPFSLVFVIPFLAQGTLPASNQVSLMDIAQGLHDITLGEPSDWKEPEKYKEWREKYTPEQLARLLSPKAFCLLYTPEKYFQMYPRKVKRFKEIAKEEKIRITEEKLPHGKKSYTSEDLCRILTPEELYQIFTAEELPQMFTPEQLRQIFTPEQLCQTFTGHELIGMFTVDGLCQFFTDDQLSMMRFPMHY
jgi:hypothetical protein